MRVGPGAVRRIIGGRRVRQAAAPKQAAGGGRVEAWICATCGIQYPPSESPPERCAICDEDRQYVRRGGQRWTTLAAMAGEGYRNELTEAEPGLTWIETHPRFPIGQRALLVRHPDGNVLWDCIAWLDAPTVERVRDLGGIAAIAISHPHYYTTMVEWAEAFGARVYVHAADRRWAVRTSDRVVFWSGDELALAPGVTVARLGGHFDGAAVLHWAAGAGGRGALLTGDTIQCVPHKDWVSFMYSYPNLTPLPAWQVRRIADAAGRFAYDRLYGAFGGVIESGAREAVFASAERYIAAVSRPEP
jgi:hypothetical protein